MADSADDLLRQAREALHDWITADESTPAEWNASGRLASAFEMLDALMSSGGPLPTDWVPAADRPVINIVIDILPALKDRDSSCAAHAALRWVPASAPVARTSPGLTSAPQAF